MREATKVVPGDPPDSCADNDPRLLVDSPGAFAQLAAG